MNLQKITTEKELNNILKTKTMTIIDFFAEWCGPCKILGPIFEKVADDYEDINFIKIDIDHAPELAAKYEISSIPTLLFLKNGELSNTIRGLIREPDLKKTIENFKKQ